ncbi:hypothetical protein D3C75_1093240 [compost metagenome]
MQSRRLKILYRRGIGHGFEMAMECWQTHTRLFRQRIHIQMRVIFSVQFSQRFRHFAKLPLGGQRISQHLPLRPGHYAVINFPHHRRPQYLGIQR